MYRKHPRFFVWLSIGAAYMLSCGTPARASSVYATLDDADFGTINLGTGVFSLLGNSGQDLAGFGEVGGNLYAAGSGPGTPGNGIIYSVNTTNGSLTAIGDSGLGPNGFGSTLSGLFAIASANGVSGLVWDVYSINSTTGAATHLGSTGLPGGNGAALSSNSSTLYFETGSNLYTIDTTTGGATLIGPTGGPQIGAIVWDGASVLYGSQDGPCCFVDTINSGTGAATTGPALSDFFVFGMAPLLTTPTPETSTLGLLGIGLAALALVRGRASVIATELLGRW
jgi:hypothetical protein